MKLYQFPSSSFCQKIRMVLAYKELPYEKVDVPTDNRTELIQVSGQKIVPVLADGAKVIIDSTWIAQYLEEKYPKKKIYPQDRHLKGLTLLIEDWADELFCTAARALTRPYRLKQELSAEEREKIVKGINLCLSTIDQALEGRDWLVGNALTLADFAVYAQLWPLAAVPTFTIPKEYRNLLSWKERFEKVAQTS